MPRLALYLALFTIISTDVYAHRIQSSVAEPLYEFLRPFYKKTYGIDPGNSMVAYIWCKDYKECQLSMTRQFNLNHSDSTKLTLYLERIYFPYGYARFKYQESYTIRCTCPDLCDIY